MLPGVPVHRAHIDPLVTKWRVIRPYQLILSARRHFA